MAERDDWYTPDEDDPDAAPTAEEIAASERLRDALAARDATMLRGDVGESTEPVAPEIALALSLRAAWAPGALSDDESRAVVDATPSAEEQASAARLRDALDSGASDFPDASLAAALRSAFSPAPLDDAEHARIIEAALAAMTPAVATSETSERNAKVIAFPRRAAVRTALGVGVAGLALAAAIALVVTSAPPHGSEAPLAKARTTQPLFSEPFRPGEASARIDRIASARASDFRDNRFRAWGVR